MNGKGVFPALHYQPLLRRDEWLGHRREILKRDGYRCRGCGRDQVDAVDHELHVHHRYYVQGKLPWEYPDEALITLCKQCHAWVELEIPAPRFKEVQGKLVRGIVPL